MGVNADATTLFFSKRKPTVADDQQAWQAGGFKVVLAPN
jgi:hypothetical protein